MDSRVKDYYGAMQIVLNCTASVIQERETDLSINQKDLYGRGGSIHFEENFLKPLIRKHKDYFYDRINRELEEAGNSWKFLGILADETTTEADKRAIYDIRVLLETPEGKASREYVNVKLTLGNTADNVGGWGALDHVIYGNTGNLALTQKAIREKILRKEPFATEPSDYFLWVFNKTHDTGKEILASNGVYSLLGSSGGFTFNMKQSFPVQFNSSKSVPFQEWDGTLEDEKKKFLKWLFSKQNAYHELNKAETDKVISELDS